MHIIGPEALDHGPDEVHTIDLWFSPKRRRWIVERLNSEGHPVGMSAEYKARADALGCFDDWLRRHPEAHLAAPREGRRNGSP